MIMIQSLTDAVIVIVGGMFALFGVFQLVKLLVNEVLVNVFGFVKVFFFTKNYRLKQLLVKPKGNRIRINNADLPYENSIGYMYFNSKTPVVFYKEGEINQINMNEIGKTGVDPDLFDKITASYFEAGKLFALQRNKLQDIVGVLVIIMTLAIIVGFAYVGFKLNMLDEIAKQVAKLG